MLNIDKNIFATNLRLTQKYCDIQKTHTEKNNTSMFRSFNPQINGDNIFKFQLSDFGLEENVKFSFLTKWSIDPTKQKNEYLLSDLYEKQLAHKKISVTKSYADIQFAGDILISQVDNTVIDGASAVASNGLIDDYDWPPIDTWFYETQSKDGRLLFAWIPHEFVSLANEAVLVNCVDCIGWFKDTQPDDQKIMTEYLNQYASN